MLSAPGMGRDMIDPIENDAQTTDDPSGSTLAQIPARTPFDFSVGLRQSGAGRRRVG
ncbi:MAG: hypothetical protein IPJ41_07820 [Phycisphaerales bacterium]|nr:hypothetical protein [Phycisphaerales bacterium]